MGSFVNVEDLDAGRTVQLPRLQVEEAPLEVRELKTLPEPAFVRLRTTRKGHGLRFGLLTCSGSSWFATVGAFTCESLPCPDLLSIATRGSVCVCVCVCVCVYVGVRVHVGILEKTGFGAAQKRVTAVNGAPETEDHTGSLENFEDLDAGRTVELPRVQVEEAPLEVRELKTLPEPAFVRQRSTRQGHGASL
jgi:hypothetical protein